MPILSATNLTSSFSNSPGSSFATSSISPAANTLILVTVSSSLSGVPNIPTISGCNLTFVQVATQENDVPNRRSTLFRALGQAPTSGALTIDFASQSQDTVSWMVDQISGVDTSGTDGSGAIVQNNTAKFTNPSAGTYSVSLSAFKGSSNGTYGILADNHGDAWNQGSNFSAVRFNGSAGEYSEFAANNQTTVDFSTSATSMQYLELLAVEIKAKAAFQGAII